MCELETDATLRVMRSGQVTDEAPTAGLRRPAGGPPCPRYRRDYVKLGAWLFALLSGPALVALLVWLI